MASVNKVIIVGNIGKDAYHQVIVQKGLQV